MTNLNIRHLITGKRLTVVDAYLSFTPYLFMSTVLDLRGGRMFGTALNCISIIRVRVGQ